MVGSPEMVRALVELGADINHHDSLEYTPLYFCINRYKEDLDLIIDGLRKAGLPNAPD